MSELLLVLLGGFLATVGGLVAGWYPADIARRAAKRDRLLVVYRELMDVTESARQFGNLHLDFMFDQNGDMKPAVRDIEAGRLQKLLTE